MSLSGLVFLLLFASGIGLALFKRPIYGLYTYIAVFYLHPPSRWWGETLPDLRWALLAAVVTLVAAWRLPPDETRIPWSQTTPAKVLIVFTLWMWLQNFWALQPEMHLEASFLFTKYVLLYYLIYRLVATPADMQGFLLVHVLGCAYLGWLAFNTTVSGRLEGVGGPGIDEANAFAMQMGTAVVVGAMAVLSGGGWKRWAPLFALPLILNGVILSGSRGGFLALVCAGAVLWLLKPWAQRKLFYVLAALGLVLFSFLAHDLFWERMGTMEAAVSDKAEIDTSALSRFAIVEAQFRMAQSYPHGAGHRGTVSLATQYLETRFLSIMPDGSVGSRSSHNTFMSALAEQGVVGAICFIYIWYWCARTVRRLRGEDGPQQDGVRRSLLASLAGALILVFVAGLFVDYIKAEVQVWLWAMLASLAASQPADRRVREPVPSRGRPRTTGARVRNAVTLAGKE